jgi:hypothetical protein
MTQEQTEQAAPLTPEQQAAQDIVDKEDYAAMLRQCLPLLRTEVLAAEYMLGESIDARDVQPLKNKFLMAAKKNTSGGPAMPFTDCALRMIAGQAKGQG